MSVDTSLQAYMASLTDAPVQQNVNSQDTVQPRVWFQRRSGNTDLFVDGTPSLTNTIYDVEVIGLDIDEVSGIADTLQTALNGKHGTMEGMIVLGIFVEDSDDEYEIRSIDTDDNWNVAAFSVRIIY